MNWKKLAWKGTLTLLVIALGVAAKLSYNSRKPQQENLPTQTYHVENPSVLEKTIEDSKPYVIRDKTSKQRPYQKDIKVPERFEDLFPKYEKPTDMKILTFEKEFDEIEPKDEIIPYNGIIVGANAAGSDVVGAIDVSNTSRNYDGKVTSPSEIVIEGGADERGSPLGIDVSEAYKK